MTERVRPIPHYEDAWPHLLRMLPDALREAQSMLQDSSLPDLVEQRFRAGDALYHGEWMDHDPEWFHQQAMEEAADHVVYLAMRRVMRSHAQ